MARLTVAEMRAEYTKGVLDDGLDLDTDRGWLRAQARIRAEVCREHADEIDGWAKASVTLTGRLDQTAEVWAAEFRARADAEQAGQEGVGNEDRG